MRTSFLEHRGRCWLAIALPVLVTLCTLLAIQMVDSMDYHHSENDFFTFWLAGHLVAQGGSPYDAAQWVEGYHQSKIDIIPNQTFLYPLPLALLMAPLGLLSFQTAFVAWVTLTQLMILGSLALLMTVDASQHAKLLFIPLLGGVILFRPTTLTLTQGQVSGMFLLFLAGVTWLWSREKWAWGGVLLGFLALKPNLGVPIIILLAIWLLLRRRMAALWGTLASGALLPIAGLLYDPNWINEYWHIGNNKLAQTFGASPTVWGLGTLLCRRNQTCGLTFGWIAASLFVLGFLWLVLRRHADLRPAAVVALGVTVTLLVTPYTWTYDQLLLILPITVVTLALDKVGYRLPFTATLFLGIDLLVIVLLVFDARMEVEILNAIVPICILGLCAWCMSRRFTANP